MKMISAEALKKEISKAPVWTALSIKEMIDELTEDIVTCGECRKCKEMATDCPSGYGYLYCKFRGTIVDESCYCSWGESK